ncbi:helix-turn-helix domain-containing protein [Streptomyces sp. XH2]|uniref:helix-turn-helix domain-containing protein n=1 Tax=Streptomyces sp. XH2 TaxID=3412483 RepID=UPI003C7B5B2C
MRAEGDEALAEIIRDMQQELRCLQRSLTSATPEDCLRLAARMRTQLDGLTAGLVGRARIHRTTWNRIARILGISDDTARHRFTDHYILRRLSELTRMGPPPASVSALYPGTTPRTPLSPVPTPPRGSAFQPAPARSRPRAAFNRLAPALSMVARRSGRSMKQISERTGCSASYLSRILSGERIPTWPLIERLARACDADPAILRPLWESEFLRSDAPLLPAQEEADDDDEDPLRAGVRLLAALQTLHIRAGQPTAYDIATASKRPLAIETVTTALDGTQMPGWCDLVSILHVLGGEIPYFQPLWEKTIRPPAPADDAGTMSATRPRPEPEAPRGRASEGALPPTDTGETRGSRPSPVMAPDSRPSRLCEIITSYREALVGVIPRSPQHDRLFQRAGKRTNRTLRLSALARL